MVLRHREPAGGATIAIVPLPRFDPMLASKGEPRGAADGWLFEPKWDGYRGLAYIDGHRTTVRTRRGYDRTACFPELAEVPDCLTGRTAVLDGELVACSDGAVDFYALSARVAARTPVAVARARQRASVVFVAFDLLWLDGPLLDQALSARRSALEGLGLAGGAWQTTPSYPGLGAELFGACERLGLEGLVAKRADSRYRPGVRSKDWLKRKCSDWIEVHAPRRHEPRR